MYFVYAVHNLKYDKIYIGETEDIDERLKAHNDGRFKNSYTACFDGEWKMIYSEKVGTRSEARLREKQLKSYQGRQFIKKYIPR